MTQKTSTQSNIVKSTEMEKKIHIFDNSILNDAENIIAKIRNVSSDDKELIEKFIDQWYSLTQKKISYKTVYAKAIVDAFGNTKSARQSMNNATIDQADFEEYVESCGLTDLYNEIVDAYENLQKLSTKSPTQPVITLQMTVGDKLKAEQAFKLEYAKYGIERNRLRNTCYAKIKDFKTTLIDLDRTKALVKNAKLQLKCLKEASEKCTDLRSTLKLYSLIESEELIKQLKTLTDVRNIEYMATVAKK